MKKLLLVISMGFLCHLGMAQDSIKTQSDTLQVSSSAEHKWHGKPGMHQKNKIKVKFGKRKKGAYFGFYPTLEFGWNRFMDNGSLSVSEDNSPLRLDKGPEFSFFPIGGGVYLNKNHSVKLSALLGLTWNTYHFEKDITILKGQDELTIETDPDKHFSKNLLRSQYLSMPVLLSIYPSGGSFVINAGVEGGLLIGGKTKQKSDELGKVKLRGNFNLNQVRYGLRFGIGYDNFNLYAKYYLSDVFAKNEGPKDFQTVAIGIGVGLF